MRCTTLLVVVGLVVACGRAVETESAPAETVDTSPLPDSGDTAVVDTSVGDSGSADPASSGAGLDAGPDSVVDEGNTATLAGRGPDDPTGLTLAWVQETGPTVTLADPQSATTTFLAPAVAAETVLQFALQARRDDVVVVSDTTTVTVRSTNRAPRVEAGADRSAAIGATVTLAGTATDLDGAVVSTAWTQVAGPEVALSDPTILAPTWQVPTVATTTAFRFRLTATDDDGASASDEVTYTVTVGGTANLRPTANAGVDQTVTEGDAVTLAGSAGDADGTIAVTAWTQLSGLTVVLSEPSALVTEFTAPATAVDVTLRFRLQVTDDDGASATDDVNVLVTTTNPRPVVDAGVGGEIVAGTAVRLSATASDDGAIGSIAWTQIAGPSVLLTEARTLRPRFTAPNVPAPTQLVLEVTVTDDRGATASDAIEFTVVPAPPP